jgi:deoxyribodipyrimidine photolyase
MLSWSASCATCVIRIMRRLPKRYGAPAGSIAFVFDWQILDALRSQVDRRVEFIHASLLELDAALRARHGALIVRHAWAATEIPKPAGEFGASAVLPAATTSRRSSSALSSMNTCHDLGGWAVGGRGLRCLV